MPTVAELAISPYQRPIRRLYFKRRLNDGTYESNWHRFDVKNGFDMVIDWGSISYEVDYQPGQVGTFDISELPMTFRNDFGYFAAETVSTSFWYPDYFYLNRKFTRIKVECGYLDSNDNEVGVASVFEGYIDRVIINDDLTASVTALPYTAVLKKYPFSDLGLTGSKTVTQIITAIFAESKISTYLTVSDSSPGNNITVDDVTTLDGTYWDVLTQLAYQSASVLYAIGSSFYFISEPAVSRSFNFKGAGTSNPNIYSVDSYDDEGSDRVRLVWQEQTTKTTVTSSNTTLLKKYLGQTQIVDLKDFDSADYTSILTALMGRWEQPKPTIEFTTGFLVNEVAVYERIGVQIYGFFSGNVPRWNSFAWNDGTRWANPLGGITILDNADWAITRLEKNINDWTFSVRAEKIT